MHFLWKHSYFLLQSALHSSTLSIQLYRNHSSYILMLYILLTVFHLVLRKEVFTCFAFGALCIFPLYHVSVISNMFMICCPAFHVAVDAIVICNVHLEFNLVAILVRCFRTVRPLLQDHLQNQVTQRSLTTLWLHPLSSNRNGGGGGDVIRSLWEWFFCSGTLYQSSLVPIWETNFCRRYAVTVFWLMLVSCKAVQTVVVF